MENKTIREGVKPLLYKWKKDYIFKTVVSSFFSFALTILYALYNGFLGIRLLSIWNGSICVFYFLLFLNRGIILWSIKNSRIEEREKKIHHQYRAFVISATMLLLLNVALICPIALMVTLKKPVNMGLIPAISMAAYTTYKIITSVMHILGRRLKVHNNILITELRTINLIDALVSILSLQNTLIMVKNAEPDSGTMLILTAVSSAVIYLIIVFITIRLLIAGVNQQKRISDGKGKSNSFL